MTENDQKDTQVEIATRLQLKWLEHMEALLISATITSTDLATLARVLLANGWSLDPSRLPKGLRDKLTAHIDPKDFEDEEDYGVVGRIA